jgi:hypothetical protein
MNTPTSGLLVRIGKETGWALGPVWTGAKRKHSAWPGIEQAKSVALSLCRMNYGAYHFSVTVA